MRKLTAAALAAALLLPSLAHAQRYTGTDGRLRVALALQPFSPTATVSGPRTLAAVNRMIAAAVRGVKAREAQPPPKPH